jgi:hypothetical protein
MKRIMIEPRDRDNVGQEVQRGIDLLRDAKITLHAGTRAFSMFGVLFVGDTDSDAALGTLRAAGIKASISN